MKHTAEELKMWQRVPLDVKIALTKQRIRHWIETFGTDGVYVSFSGGKDSTVLLHIIREQMGYKDIPAVFSDTGLEYPEIREFVKTFDNVVWVKPQKTFKQVIQEYGYPFISKEISGTIGETRKWLDRQGITWNALTDRQTDSIKYACHIADLLGIPRRGKHKNNETYLNLKKGILPKLPIRVQMLTGSYRYNGALSPFNKTKWAFLMEAPFVISNQCCSVMKKRPMKKYSHDTGRHPITATMAEESKLRESNWIKYGCNMYDAKEPISNPMSFWTEQDVLEYIKKYKVPICSVYGDIVVDDEMQGQISLFDLGITETAPKLTTTGCKRTGCMFCGYGCHLEKGEGRFERMKKTHPKQYEFIMKPTQDGGLNYKEVIDWINEHGNLNIRY